MRVCIARPASATINYLALSHLCFNCQRLPAYSLVTCNPFLARFCARLNTEVKFQRCLEHCARGLAPLCYRKNVQLQNGDLTRLVSFIKGVTHAVQ